MQKALFEKVQNKVKEVEGQMSMKEKLANTVKDKLQQTVAAKEQELKGSVDKLNAMEVNYAKLQ